MPSASLPAQALRTTRSLSRRAVRTLRARGMPAPPPPAPTHTGIEDLTRLRPEAYETVDDHWQGRPVPVFVARSPDDFDWLEKAILEYRYYEQGGVWTLAIDDDKRVMAEIVASLGGETAFELGCSNGGVLACLDDLGVVAEGVDISDFARRFAAPRVRDRIHIGDPLDVHLDRRFDVVYGLDIFEHFNPNRLHAYLERTASLVRPGGHVFVNVPAYGDDPVFGPVFPLALEEWEPDRTAGRNFSHLHVDDHGWPVNGHLVLAEWAWWETRFEQTGLRREPELERALHDKYDWFLKRNSVARMSFFVFSKPPAGEGAATAEHIRAQRSAALTEIRLRQRARRLRRRLRPLSDEVMVRHLYESLLGRDPDPEGFEAAVRSLEWGAQPVDLAIEIAHSEEFRQRMLAAETPPED
jgi:SAM-dependent methyltransferase